jgi:acyl-CoA reductase-like NAD-dependent aldehyde dehydrogenase
MTISSTLQATLTIGGEPQAGAAGSYPVHNPARPAEIVGLAPAADRAQLAEAGFEIDTAPMVAAVLGSMAEAALTPEQIDPQAPYPRLHREPYGVAALVIPFNWPLTVMMTKLTSALAAGNPGVVNVLSAPGVDLAQAFTHPGIDVISLTGGPATGRAVMAAAAPRLTPLLLELGGNDAAIIAPDIAVSDQLVEQLVTATYTTGGQVCMAIKRLYAPRDRVDEVTLGPLHTAAARDRVEMLVKDAAAQGATVRTAGRIREADADAGGYFVLPTVVTDVAPDSALASEEQFGPVQSGLGRELGADGIRAFTQPRGYVRQPAPR